MNHAFRMRKKYFVCIQIIEFQKGIFEIYKLISIADQLSCCGDLKMIFEPIDE